MSHSSFTQQVNVQNQRGVKTPKSLQINMNELFQLESLPNCDYKTNRIEKVSAFILRDIQAMTEKVITLATVKIQLDSTDTMYRKVIRYKRIKYNLALLEEDYNRRRDELVKKLGEIETSIPKSQHGQFSLAVTDGVKLSQSEMEDTAE